MYDCRTRATRTADRAAAMARTEAFVALRAAEISARGPVTGGDPETVLADLEASLSPILAAPARPGPARDPEAMLAELQAGLAAAVAQGRPQPFRVAC